MNLILMLLLTLTDVYTKMGASLREKIQGMKDNEKNPRYRCDETGIRPF